MVGQEFKAMVLVRQHGGWVSMTQTSPKNPLLRNSVDRNTPNPSLGTAGSAARWHCGAQWGLQPGVNLMLLPATLVDYTT